MRYLSPSPLTPSPTSASSYAACGFPHYALLLRKVYKAYPQQLTPGDYTREALYQLADLTQSICALHRAQVTYLAALVIALFKAKTVNLAQLASYPVSLAATEPVADSTRIGLVPYSCFRMTVWDTRSGRTSPDYPMTQ